MKFLVIEEVDSTNSYVSLHAAELENFTMVIADRQTAGRGQRGNSWESEPGKNLTFTLFYKPVGVEAIDQFAISEATALAVRDFLVAQGIDAKIKWPNDIYVGDKKISGILIEHSLTGRNIDHSRIGVGLNINQKEFLSDAPNPVSVYNIKGDELDISRAAAALGAALENRLAMTSSEEAREKLHQDFKENLWRFGGGYRFRERGENAEVFIGEIRDVSPRGPITISDQATGQSKSYAFKEIEYII